MTSDKALSNDGLERGLDTHELLDRLAERLRAESDTDLPHAFFLDQLRTKLTTREPAANRNSDLQSSACFDAWAHTI